MILHADLFVDSMTRSLAFYGALGFEVIDDTVVDGALPRHVSDGHYDAVRLVLLRVSAMGTQIELLELLERSRRTAGPRRPTSPHAGRLGVLVADLARAIERLREIGAEPTGPALRLDVPGVGAATTIAIDDPDGHALLLVQRPDPAPATGRAAPPR